MIPKEQQIIKSLEFGNQPILICPEKDSLEISSKITNYFEVNDSDITRYNPAEEGVSELREKFKRVFIRPHSSQIKVFFVVGVDRLNIEQANSILKVLEEPPAYLRIVLFATSLSKVIPTILSRVKKIVLPYENISHDRDFNILNLLDLPFNKFIKEINQFDDNQVKLAVMGGIEELRIKGLNDFRIDLFNELGAAYNKINNTNVNQKLLLEEIYFNEKNRKETR